MTATHDRDDYLATTEHRQPSRILYRANFTPDLRRRVIEHIGSEDLEAHYGFMAHTHIGLARPRDLPAIDYSPWFADQQLPEGTVFTSFGAARVPAGFYHFFGYISPLRNAASLREIEQYPLDDLQHYDSSLMAAAVADAHAHGRVSIGGVGHMYETAWQIRGYEPFLMDLIERPAWAQCLLDRLFHDNMLRAEACARAGVDQLQCGDDVANQNALMFSKPMWRDFMLSRWARVWQAVRAISPRTRIWYHSDGNITPIIHDLIDAGVSVLNPLQPECLDLDAIHRDVGHLVTFDGTIGTQSTMPWGTPEQVRARVKEVIDKFGRNGGLIISPTHVLEPEVPIANIDALCDACREFGTFRQH